MAGIYIHVPFCTQKCGYCDFYSIIRMTDKDAYINAVIEEAVDRKEELKNKDINTIYFGGGTPSLLKQAELGRILDAVHQNYNTSGAKEVTMEVNPDDVTPAYISQITALGINRLSMGVQSFNNKILTFMNRRHNANGAKDAVRIAQEGGIKNISIDLIYGIPNMEFDVWKDAVDTALSLGVQHISAYHLTFEPETPFFKRLQNKEILEIDDTYSVAQYNYLVEAMVKAGYVHYEISNFCLPDMPSMHNSNYWTGTEYLGLGPSAHSYIGEKRRWNNRDLSQYIHNIEAKEAYYESEVLSDVDRYNELIMLGLRTAKGVDVSNLEHLFTADIMAQHTKNADLNIKTGNVLIEGGFMRVQLKKKFLTDQIITSFFIV